MTTPYPLPVSSKKPSKYPTLNNAYLLLVEDNLINQDLMSEILIYEGIRVDLANNGKVAIAMIAKNDYSAVLMDCRMPVMDGFEASRFIRANPRFADLPIIAITGNVMTKDVENCLASGMNDHIAKPIDWDLFFQTLVRWISPQISNTTKKIEPTIDSKFPLLTGVDLELVRKQTGNNIALYQKVLNLFCANHKDDIELIKAAYQAGDHPTAAQLAHKLKGSASSIGMTALSDLILELEQSLKQPSDIRLEALLKKIQPVLTQLISEINQLEFSVPNALEHKLALEF